MKRRAALPSTQSDRFGTGLRSFVIRKYMKMLSIAVFALAAPVLAHHSTGEYDRNGVTEFEGEVIRAVWRNPHVGLTVRVTADDGSFTDWTMEAADYTGTMRRGVPDGAFKAGDWVKVAGNPSTRRDARMLVTNVLLPDETEVLLVRTQPRWSDRYVGGGDWIIEDQLSASESPTGIFRVWTLDSTQEPAFASDPPLTETARAAHANWDTYTDPALQCAQIGLPRVMTRTGPHPIEFVNRGDVILLRGEYFDTERVIHMEDAGASAAREYGPLGYSVGQWDGSSLVVYTTHIDYPYFDIRGLEGVPQSRNVAMTEVFTPIDDSQALQYDITVVDSAAFTEPVIAEDYALWRWRPGVSVEPYDCRL